MSTFLYHLGWIFDTTGTYSVAFYVTGFCGFVSALLVIPVCQRRNCFFWSYRLSRSGSSTSFVFKPLSFMKEGVYGPAVCSKRNYDPSIRILRQPSTNNGRHVKVDEQQMMVNNMLSVQQQQQQQLQQPTVTPTAVIACGGKSNGHHVLIIGDDGGGASGNAGGDDDDSKRLSA